MTDMSRDELMAALTAPVALSRPTTARPTVIPSPRLSNEQGYTAADLVRMEFPEPRFAVDGIVPEGVTILAGRPKHGKSWLCLGLGVAIAAGGHALGQIPVEQGDVLYLALEDNQRRLKSRLLTLLGDEEAPRRLWFHTDWPRVDKGGVNQIAQWLEDHRQARLVIIDTLARFRPIVKEGGYAADYNALAALQKMVGEYGVSAIVVHHLRKLAVDKDGGDWIDAVSGTLGLAGAADGLMGLFRVRGSQDAVLKVTGRDQDDSELGLRFDPVSASWSLEGKASDLLLSPERAAIVQLLRRTGTLTPAQIADELKKNRSTTRSLLQRMVVAEQLIAEGDRYSAAEAAS